MGQPRDSRMFSAYLGNCPAQVTKPQLPAPSLCKCMRRNAQRQPNIAQFAMRSEKYTRNGVIILSKNRGDRRSRMKLTTTWGLSHALFCHLHPQYKCKNVKARGEIEPQWIHADAGHEPVTEDINYSAVTIALPICKLMLSSNCTGLQIV